MISLAGARLKLDTRRRHVGIGSYETRALLGVWHYEGLEVTKRGKVGGMGLDIALA